jgi:sporulation protein YlmC with PRC-barrel domain
MKTLRSFGITLAILGMAIVPMSAQTQSTTVQVSKLVGTKVKSSQGDEVGVIKDVVIDRSSGCMAYTVLSTEGGGGTATGGAGKLVAVPWTVYSPSSDVTVLTTTVDRQRIYSAPVFDYARIDEYSRPDYITNVYSYYGVTQGAVGVSGTSNTTDVSRTTTDASSAATTGRSTAAGGVSPAATNSPAATRSPVERESPAGKRSPRPHATASPHARGEASETPSSRRERGSREKPEETESSRTKEGQGTKARPEETEPPSGGAELQREPSEATRESPEATNSGERTREENQKRPHRKPERSEANTPPPEGGGEQQ